MAQVFEDLAKKGHEISVITTFPHYEGFRTWPQHRRKLRQTDDYKGMTVTRVYSYTSGTKTMRRRLLNYLSFNVMAIFGGLFRRKGFDLVFCTNGSFFSGLSGWLIARARRAKVVYNLQDLYPEVPVLQGQLKSRRAIATLERIEKFMYRRADHLSLITPSFSTNLQSKGVPQEKMTIIPNFVDTAFIRPLPKVNDFSVEHGLEDKFVVSHAGNVGYVYDLPTLLDAADLLKEREDIVFLIIGEGVGKEELEKTASERVLRNVRFLPFQPQEKMPLIRAACDVQVALYKAGAARYSMPSKIYEIMASGRPLLASADTASDVWQLVEKTRCGVCLLPGKPDELAATVVDLKENSESRMAMGSRGRSEAEWHYSRESASKAYEELFERVRSSPR